MISTSYTEHIIGVMPFVFHFCKFIQIAACGRKADSIKGFL